MRILALIPARSGSKRVPNKNIRLLGGKPLIAWTIETALSVPGICDVLVSTDSVEIQVISTAAGASVPWLRPNEIATDEASSIDVAIHALDWYEKRYGEVGGLLLLQPTSPFRTKEYISQGIEMYLASSGESVIGVSPVRDRPSWMVTIEKNRIKQINDKQEISAESQNMNNLYIVNGGFYLTSPKILRKYKSFYSSETKPLICKSILESIDIDTKEEFEFAEFCCSHVFNKGFVENA